MAFTPYPNEVYSAFSFIGFIMCIIPLPWHLKTWNAGTCLYMFWTGIGCLIFFINSIMWRANALNPAPVWCDICVRILIGCSVGVPASSLCINRRLYLVQLNPAGNRTTKSDKMRVLAIDLGISVGLPIFIIILQYISQGHRFNILEDIGCYPHNYNTWVGVLILNVPPVLIGFVSAIYAVRSIISMNRRRTEFNELLSRHLNVTSNLYSRLMWLAGIEALLTVPIAGLFLVYNMNHLYPWISWEDTHSNFGRVGQFPALLWHCFPAARLVEFGRWIYVICAFLFFSFFGFAEEARLHYRLAIKFILKVLGIRGGRQPEIITFRAGPISRSDPSANKRHRRADSFSTISTASLSSGRSEKEEEPWLQGDVDDHFVTQTGPRPISSEIAPQVVTDEKTAQRPSKDTHVSADKDPPTVGSRGSGLALGVEQEKEPRPSIVSSRITRMNLRSFLHLGHNDPSIQHNSFPHSSQMDISTVEEGQVTNPKRRSSRRFSRHFRSFLNFN